MFIPNGFLAFIRTLICQRLKLPPTGIFLPVVWITNRCNLRCKMCDQWKTDSCLFPQELNTREWFSFVDSVERMKPIVMVVTGGELFLRDDIFDILGYIKKKKISLHICTNGVLLDGIKVKKIKELGIDSISVSLDSHSAHIHNELRGIDCFDKAVNGIKLLREFIPNIHLGINCVISKRNFRDIYRMIPFAEKLGVGQIKFDLIHTNLMHRRKDVLSFSGLLFNAEDYPEFRSEVNKLIFEIRKTKLLSNSGTFMRGLLEGCGGSYPSLRCHAGYLSCAIDAFGRVSPCDNFDGKESIRDKPFEEIWSSDSFHDLRQKVQGCVSRCWDTTHAEINIRCSLRGFMKEFRQILKEKSFYLYRKSNS